jgi:SAM-dependent methyltransferase
MTAPAIDPAIVRLYGAITPAIEEILVATTRTLARTVPAPRDDPYYGLDRIGGPSLRLLQRLSRHGDFRKYVFVLDAGAGLGGPARWLAVRYGCRVVGLELAAVQAAVIARLSRRAGLAGQVHGLAGSFEAVPVRDGAFTQIWSVEALHHAANLQAAIAELARVLRPGSPLALQEIVRRGHEVTQIGGIWHHHTAADYRQALEDAGFADLEEEDVTEGRDEISPVVLSARERFARELEESLPVDSAWSEAARARDAVAAITAGPDYRVVQFFARRPSV